MEGMKSVCEECGQEHKGSGRFCSRDCQVRALNRKPERTYAGRKAAGRP